MSTVYQVTIPDEIRNFIPRNIESSQVCFEDLLEAYQDSLTFQKMQESTRIQELDKRLQKKLWNM